MTKSTGKNLSEKSYVLAIDNGTQSVRALLFDLQPEDNVRRLPPRE